MEKVIVYDVSRYSGAIRNWWASLTLGIIFLAFGILVFTRTGDTWLGLTLGFACMVIISGVLELITGGATPVQAGRGRLIATGVIEILLGAIIIMIPEVLFVYLPLVLGFWLMFRGYSMVSNSSDMVGYGIKGAGLTLAFGILTILTSFLMLAVPFIGFGSYALWLGLALLFAAIGTVFYAVQLAKLRKYLA
jgi:uncharacterized membrane protein HdeD (DUF308 family)